LTSALDGGEWSASTHRERAPGTHWIEGWVAPRTVLDAVVKRKIPSLFLLRFNIIHHLRLGLPSGLLPLRFPTKTSSVFSARVVPHTELIRHSRIRSEATGKGN